MSRVHVAIIRHVKPGFEADFERAIRQFAVETSHEPGAAGLQLLGPLPATTHGEYGLLRTFDNQEACDAFYASERFANFQEGVRHLVEGDGERRELSGLEAFFRAFGAPPPRWKMALLTWLGVFLAVAFWNWALPPATVELPYLLEIAVRTALTVITLTWVVMPRLTGLFASWLKPAKPKVGKH